MQELAMNNHLGKAPAKLASLQGSPHHDFCGHLPCDFLHPGRGCVTNFFAFLPQAYLRALPVYAPVYILPAMLVHRHKLLKASLARPAACLNMFTHNERRLMKRPPVSRRLSNCATSQIEAMQALSRRKHYH